MVRALDCGSRGPGSSPGRTFSKLSEKPDEMLGGYLR